VADDDHAWISRGIKHLLHLLIPFINIFLVVTLLLAFYENVFAVPNTYPIPPLIRERWILWQVACVFNA